MSFGRTGWTASWNRCRRAGRLPEGCRFHRQDRRIPLLPGAHGVDGAVLGIGTDASPFVFGNLSAQLPDAGAWRLVPGDYDDDAAILGYCLGAYRYNRFRSDGRGPAHAVRA